MKIRKGDTVRVMKGKNSGKQGKVLHTYPKVGKVLVEGINEKIRHTRPRRQGQKGQRVTVYHPVPVANVMVICSSCGKGTRVGFERRDDKKIRVCKKCKKSFS